MINVGKSLDEDPEVFLIDFGFSQKFVKSSKEHISETQEQNAFRGNLAFASVRQMSFSMTSRVDDLISLFYMLIYMLNDNCLWVGSENPFAGKSGLDQFISIKDWKTRHDLPQIADLFCKQFVFPVDLSNNDYGEHMRTQMATFRANICLLAAEIQSTGFNDQPRYSKIRKLLEECKKVC